ncbi:uncharacterized protein LOC127257703 [Andrographis paniculata]|uniref:uncharacterized protein LOC127257703 n=1 Tax=Andrographis paniculata TaxID=175694 RepID=UPI0021E8E7E7|nr:uncharacterized protein LOC127257703 [Andrographis paniculata]
MDLIRLILHRPTMQERLMKWAIRLAPFALRHRPIKAVKGQVVADLLAEFAGDESLENKVVPYIGSSLWKICFDGSRSKGKSGPRVILEGPGASKISLQLQMEEMTHNSAEYEALILGLEALIAKGVQSVLICGDSQLVINQVLKRYACKYPHLRRYRDLVFHLLYKIAEVVFEHVPRTENRLANNLAHNACQQMIGSTDSGIDWRTEIMVYLESPSFVTSVGIRLKALRFQLIEGVLFAKGCQECRRHGPLNHLPTVELQTMVKPWPFKAWALDVIGKIHPTSSKQHSFILVAIDYFTKWVEAVPLKNATHKEVIEFVLNHIVYRFGIPHTLTTN